MPAGSPRPLRAKLHRYPRGDACIGVAPRCEMDKKCGRTVISIVTCVCVYGDCSVGSCGCGDRPVGPGAGDGGD